MDDETRRDSIAVNIRMSAYKRPEAEPVRDLVGADGCSCQGTMGQGTGGDCKCGSQTGAGSQ